MTRAPRVFGPGGEGPIRVFWTDDPELPARFNESSTVVFSVNREVVNAASAISYIYDRVSTSLAETVVFELFAADIMNCPIEIGNRVPVELVKIILDYCFRYDVSLAEVYKVEETGRFGYCQRVYIGSRKPSGVHIKAGLPSDLLKSFSMSKGTASDDEYDCPYCSKKKGQPHDLYCRTRDRNF